MSARRARPSFAEWFHQQRHRTDSIGKLAADVANPQRRARSWLLGLMSHDHLAAQRLAATRAFREYKAAMSSPRRGR